MILLADNPTVDLTGDSGWVVFFKALFVFVFLVIVTLLTIWAERKVVGRMQSRPGPTETGPFGLLQSLADGIKLALKEDIIPTAADKAVFIVAPIISATTAFVAFSVIPFGPEVRIPFTDTTTALQLTDLPVAVLFVLAVASIGVYGIVLGGWSSGSTYPLLGALRSSAQVVSYEIAMGLALIGVFLYAGSMSTSAIVEAQGDLWYAVMLFPSFVVYVISMVGETNRAPFDLPEAEGELVGGFHTEYSSLKFALFFLAEYINMVTVSALATTVFLGGWMAPWPFAAAVPGTDFVIWAGANDAYWPVMWFLLKLIGFIFLFIWLRGTLPRLRYDQFMKFGWKVLIPFSLVWIVVASGLKAMNTFSEITFRERMFIVGGFVAIVFVIFLAWDFARERRVREQEAAEAAIDPDAEVDPFAGGFPVPALPGQRLLRTSGARSPDPALTPLPTGSPGTTTVEEAPRG